MTLTVFLPLSEASLDEDVAEKRLRAKVAEEYAAVLRLRVVPVLGHRRVSSLTPQDADRVTASVRKKGLAPATVRRAVITLVRLLRFAERERLVSLGTADKIKLPSGRRMGEPKRLSPAQVRAVLAVLHQEAAQGEQAALVALIAAYTGVRRSEALAIRWRAVDLEKGTAAIVEGLTELSKGDLILDDPKTLRSRRTVHLPSPLVAALREARRGLRSDSSSPSDRAASRACRSGQRGFRSI